MKCPLCEKELDMYGYSCSCNNSACVLFPWLFALPFWSGLTAAVEESNKRAVERYKQEIAAKVAIAERPGWTQHNDAWLWNQNTKVRIGTDHIKLRFTVQIPMGGEQFLRAFEFETPDEAMEFAEKALELVKKEDK